MRYLNRREFFKIGGLIVGSALLTSSLPIGENPSIGKRHSRILNPEGKTHIDKFYEEIAGYRDNFQLPPIPTELSEGYIQAAMIFKKPTDLPKPIIDLPDHEQSYALRLIEDIEHLFGPNIWNDVHRIDKSGGVPVLGYLPHNRVLSLNIDLHGSFDLEDNEGLNKFDYVVAHEAGHGSHPIYGGRYTYENLVKYSHGAWKALSKFLDHEANLYFGMILPRFESQVAEVLGKLFEADINLTNQVDLVGYSNLTKMMAEYAVSNGTNLNKLQFSKKACREIGHKLIPMIFNKNVRIHDLFLADYTAIVEGGFLEIISEMIAASIFSPERINNDLDVIAGVEELLSAVADREIHIEDLRVIKNNVSSEILDKFRKEKQILAIPPQMVDSPSLSSETVVDLEARIIFEQEQNRLTSNFAYFVDNGNLPADIASQITEEEIAVMTEWSQKIKIVLEAYPTVFSGLEANNLSFDPNIHVWKTREVARAVDQSVIWNLLAEPKLILENLQDIKDRIVTLQEFIDSDDFGFNNYIEP